MNVFMRSRVVIALLFLCALNPATASAESVAATLTQWGLMGTHAADCARPPSRGNAYVRYVGRADGSACQLLNVGVGSSLELETATLEAGGVLVLRATSFQKAREWGLTRGPDGRIRTLFSREVGGDYSVRDGKLAATGAEVPWLTACEPPPTAARARDAETDADLRALKDVMDSLLRAAETLDGHLWAQGLSAADRAEFDAAMTPAARSRSEQAKQELEGRYRRSFGPDLFEYTALAPLIDVTSGRGLPHAAVAMAHIREATIWDGRYAELVLLLPFDVRGYLPPMRFFFVKEEGRWKLCQWLAARLLLGWQLEKNDNPDATVNILLKTRTGLDLDRGNCAIVRQGTFPVDAAVSAAYRAAVDEAQPGARNQLLLFWALTGDKEGEERLAAEDTKNPKAGLPNLQWQQVMATSTIKPCAPPPPGAGERRATPETPELWLQTLGGDPVGLRALVKRFPGERRLCAKALLQLAATDVRREAFEEAADGYANIVKAYAELPEEVTEAKTQLARLSWSNLDRKKEAIRLWRELEAVGKLPADANLGERPLTVTTLVKDSASGAAGWLSGIKDFDVTADGGLVVLQSATVAPGGKDAGALISRLDLHDTAGKLQKTLVQEQVPRSGIGEIFMTVQRSGDKYGVTVNSVSGKVVLFDASGQFAGELARKGDGFVASATRSTASYGDNRTELNTRALLLRDGSFGVLTREKVRLFDYSGALTGEFPVPSEETQDNYKPCLTGSPAGDLVFTHPLPGKAFKLDRAGTVTPLQPPPGEGGRGAGNAPAKSQANPEKAPEDVRKPWHPQDVVIDRHDNIYVYDGANHALLKFQGDGSFVAEAAFGGQVPRWVKRMRLDGRDRALLLIESGGTRSIVRVDLAAMFEDQDR
jgi:hypothetical protein